jgi:hypothetical protein
MAVLYFAYGSNMSSARLIDRVGSIAIVGAARLPDYQHLFNKHGSDETAKGNIQPRAGREVHGALYQLTGEQTTILDRYEGGYQRLWIEVAGQRALTYEAVRLSDELEPTTEYLHHYVRGVREHGIPDHYLQAILPDWFDPGRL